MIKLSIIIPMYNASATVGRTLDSIYNLPLKKDEYEVIVIDDASSDNSVSIIEDRRLKNENLILLKQPENHRQGAARNRGIAIARGHYIDFCDADDELDVGIVTALEKAIASKVDIEFCDYKRLRVTGKIDTSEYKGPYETMMSGKEFCNTHFRFEKNLIPVAYLYRTDYLRGLKMPFPEDVRLEDGDWVLRAVYKAKTMQCVEDNIYIQHCMPDSTMLQKANYLLTADWIDTAYRKIVFADSIVADDAAFAEKIHFDARHNIVGTCKKLWRLTCTDLARFYKRVGTEKRVYLLKKKWPKWTSICLTHPMIAQCVLFPIAPVLRLAKDLKNRL